MKHSMCITKRHSIRSNNDGTGEWTNPESVSVLEETDLYKIEAGVQCISHPSRQCYLEIIGISTGIETDSTK